MCQGNFRKLSPHYAPIKIVLLTGYIYIMCEKQCGNENSPTYPTKVVKYHYPNEFTVISW